MEIRLSRARAKVSLVLRLIDAYTGGDPGDPTLRVVLENIQTKPIRKSRGLYIYENLVCDQVKLTIHSTWYRLVEQEIHFTEPYTPVYEYISLKPASTYSFPPSATLIRANVSDGNEALVGVEVVAYALDPDCAAARVSEDASIGSDELRYISLTGNLQPGDQLAIAQSQKREQSEVYTILSVANEESKITLQHPIRQSIPRGTLLALVSQTFSGSTGEVVVPFRGNRKAVYDVHLQLSYGGNRLVKEVKIEEGNTVWLGQILFKHES